MTWVDRLERRFGGWSVPGLATFLVGMNGGVWVLSQFKPSFPWLLALAPDKVLAGEPWRLVTFLFIPPTRALLWTIVWLSLLYTYVRALEEEWGDFRLTLYYGIGAVATAASSMALGIPLTNTALNATLFLAFAALHPDFELLLFFIVPVKARWLAWAAWAGCAWVLAAGAWSERIATLAGLSNYALFFGARHWQQARLRLHHWRRGGRFGG